MADRQPRPGLSVLLAGRFRVSRTALLARPAGPLVGADVGTGAVVRVRLAPPDLDDAELRRRVARANALGRAGCPLVEVADDPPARWLALHPPDGAVDLGDARPTPQLAARASALGAALDAAGLGLEHPEQALGVAAGEPCLLEPPVGAADPALPLAVVLAEVVAARVGEGPPADPGVPVQRGSPSGLLGAARTLAASSSRQRVAIGLAAVVAVLGGYAAAARIGGSAGPGRAGPPAAVTTTVAVATAAPGGTASAPAAGPTPPAGRRARRRGGVARSPGPRPRAGRPRHPTPREPAARSRGGIALPLPWPRPPVPRSRPVPAPSPPPRRPAWHPLPAPPSVCQSAGLCT